MTQLTQNIMSRRLITVPMGTSSIEALKIMKTNRFRHLPITDELADVVGIVSMKDLSTIPSADAVEAFMTSPVEHIKQTEPLQKAVFKMLDKKISCLLVSNDNEDIVGIVTTDDLLWYLAYLLQDDTEKTRSIFNITNLQTVGDVINSLSEMGI